MGVPLVRLGVALFAFVSGFVASNSIAANIYIKDFPDAVWRDLDPLSRLQFLQLEGVEVYIGGPIAPGDFDELTAIHDLVPIHTLHISSSGGSVPEAIRISEFSETYSIAVTTDYEFECARGSKRSSLPSDGQCGCASACALIWLAAPARSGNDIKIHRPYFTKGDFATLPDDEAVAAYNRASQQVRDMLEKRGYSKEFLGRLFNIPRENYEALKRSEIDVLPVDTSLDELVSARCYGDNENSLSLYHGYQHQVAQLRQKVRGLSASLPGDVILGELAKDSYYGPILKDRDAAAKQQDAIEKKIAELAPVQRSFESCKRAEREKVSLRKSGARLAPATREKLKKFAELVSLNADLAVLVPNDPDTNKPLGMYVDEMNALRSELKAELASKYWTYIVGPR